VGGQDSGSSERPMETLVAPLTRPGGVPGS